MSSEPLRFNVDALSSMLTLLQNPEHQINTIVILVDDMEAQKQKFTYDQMIAALACRPASMPATMPPLRGNGPFAIQLFLVQGKMKAAKEKVAEAEALRPLYEVFDYDLSQPNNDVLYKQVSIPGCGKGLVAKENIARGTMIIMDLPLLRLKTAPCDNSYITEEGEKAYLAENHEIAKSVKEMGKHEQRIFLSLHKYDKSGKAPFIGIVNANALPVEPTGLGVFPEISKLNHACAPNAEYSFNTTTGEARVYAVRHIGAGQEITINYSGYRWTHETRRIGLAHCFGFSCKCNYICGTTEGDLRAHEKIWEHFASLNEYLEPETAGFMIRFGEEALYNMFTRHNMCQMMRISDSRAVSSFFWAWQICLAHGDTQRAQCFGLRSLVSFRDCLGEEHPTVKIMDRRLKEYRSEAIFEKTSYWKGTMPEDENVDTSVLTDKQFRNWLWHPGVLKLMVIPDTVIGSKLAWWTIASIPWLHNHPELTRADFDLFNLLSIPSAETGENDFDGSTARSYSPRPASTVEGSEKTFVDAENEDEQLGEGIAGLGITGDGNGGGFAEHGVAIDVFRTEEGFEYRVTATTDGNMTIPDPELANKMTEDGVERVTLLGDKDE